MFTSVLAILLGFLVAVYRVEAAPLVVQGGADLSVVDWSEEGIVPLSGDWQFYWNQLLSPAEIDKGEGRMSAYLSPEAQWQKTVIPGIELQRFGAATYSLRLYLNEPMNVTLLVPLFNSASRIWFNGELKQEFGKVSLNESEEQGYVRDSRLQLAAKTGVNSIVIQTSNHTFWYGGASLPVRIGPTSVVQEAHIMLALKDAISFGFILFMSLYHIYIRFILKRSNGALYFGLFGLGIGLRLALVGEGQVFYSLWPDISLNQRFFLEYMAVASSVALLTSFYRELFPNEFPNRIYRAPIWISITWCLLIVLLPPLYYPMFLEVFHLIIMACGVASIVSLVIAAQRNRDGARILVMATGLFFLAVANDLAYSQRIIYSVQVVHYGFMLLLFSQALILAQRFGRSFDRAERAEQEVTQLNHSLEEKIVARTEQINTILSHVRSGFLLIDQEACLQTGYTSSCETILGQGLEVGKPLPAQLGFPHRINTQFSLAVQQIFAQELPIEVALQQLPTRFPVGQRIVGLQAAAVKQRSTGQVSAVLLTINDVTDLVAAEEGLRRADVLIQILEDQDAFRIFLADFKQDLQNVQNALVNQDGNALHASLHTMKGNAASFNLEDWVKRLHQLEEKTTLSTTDIDELTEHVRGFLRQNEGILHLDFDHPLRSVFGVDQSDLIALKDTLTPVASTAALARVEHWSRGVRALPLKSYTNPLHSMVNRVARQLQKNVALIVEGADVKVDNGYGRLLATLPHLIRNALVHGIEDPEDRYGKPEQATIFLRFRALANGGLQIDIEDDGRGLDSERILRHARELDLVASGNRPTDEAIFALIFHPSFSTAEKVSDLAGRGMGLAAVATAVQELGGTYQVRSQKNRGVQFSLSIPTLHVDSSRTLTAS